MGTSTRKYSNPPLREAALEVRFNFQKKPDFTQLEDLYKKILSEYPTKKINKILSLAFRLVGKEQPKMETNQGEDGLRAISSDGTRIVQIFNDRFVFSKLKPYENWNDFSSGALNIFNEYVSTLQPATIERIGLRYINAIKIPERTFDLQEYFEMHCSVPDRLPHLMYDFFSRIRLIEPNTKAEAIVTQLPEKHGDLDTFILDIDVYRESLGIKTSDREKFLKVVSDLKEFRTKIFDSALTEKAKDGFK
jgi:uncharacterized protein (TIGR04255 family)